MSSNEPKRAKRTLDRVVRLPRFFRERTCCDCQTHQASGHMIRCDLCRTWRCAACHASIDHMGNCREANPGIDGKGSDRDESKQP